RREQIDHRAVQELDRQLLLAGLLAKRRRKRLVDETTTVVVGFPPDGAPRHHLEREHDRVGADDLVRLDREKVQHQHRLARSPMASAARIPACGPAARFTASASRGAAFAHSSWSRPGCSRARSRSALSPPVRPYTAIKPPRT